MFEEIKRRIRVAYDLVRSMRSNTVKGNLNVLTGTFMAFAVLVIVVAVTLLIGAQTQTQVQSLAGTGSIASQGVNNTIVAVFQMTQWLPIVVVVIIGSLLIMLVMGAFRQQR